jgi:8-oxo-dGTP pyrophosphatase MutT (NUDIX family)
MLPKAVNVLLVTKNDEILLQQRDDKPEILNPGKLNAFGGRLGDGEKYLEGALRELAEETNLRPKADDLELLADYEQHEEVDGITAPVACFVLHDVEPESLEVYEGRGFVGVPKGADLTSYNLSLAARYFVERYWASS